MTRASRFACLLLTLLGLHQTAPADSLNEYMRLDEAQLAQKCLQATTGAQCQDAQNACSLWWNHALQTQQSKPLNLADALDGRALCQLQLAQLVEAAKLFLEEIKLRQELARRKSQRAPDQPAYAAALKGLAATLHEQGRHGVAESPCRQAVAIDLASFGDAHPKYATSLGRLAESLEGQGRYSEAKPLYEQALKINQRKLGARHPESANSLRRLGRLLAKLGSYVEAERLLRESISILSDNAGRESPDALRSAVSLGAVLAEGGRYDEARRLLDQGEAFKRVLGEHDPSCRDAGIGLSHVSFGQGKYLLAERELSHWKNQEEALARQGHPEYARILNLLGAVQQKVGRSAGATTFFRQAMAVNQQMSRQQHPYYASSLEGLTGVLREQGQYEAAEPLQRQALEIRRATLGTQHPEYAQSQLELAALFQAQGKTQDAEPLYRQALQALKPTTSGPRLRYAEGLINLGTLLGDQGKLREADALGEQALDVVQRAVGKNHPLYAACLRQLAKTRIAQGQAAVENLRQAVEISEALLGDTVSESRVRALVELLRGEEDLVYSQLLTKPQHGPTLSLATALTLLRKGRSEDAGMRARAAVRRATGFAQFDDQFSQWENFRREHEKLILMGSQGRPSAQYFEQLDELSRQAEQLEYSLVSENDRLRANKPPPLDRIVAEVAQRLPPDGALLELVFVQPSQLSTAASADATAPHYLGILLFPDQRLASFDLGTAQTVEKAVVSLRKDTQNSASDPLEAAQALYQMLLGPAQEKLVNVRKLFVSADGALSFVPFAALHDGHDYLIARYEFHYLTSGRDLLRPSSTTPPGPALLLGNPRFRPPTGPGPMEIAALPKTPAPDAVPGLYDLVQDLPPIPNTRVEVESLARLIQVHPFTGDSAAEARLRTARGPHVLHIASHGVFLDDLTAAGPGGSRVGIRVKLAPTEPASSAPAALFPQIKNPLSRSALVLAPGGGLTFGERFHDGLLTADEVRGLDLRGTRLVVLSACDSGRGALSTGQGVYGLRRSFLIAGAETLVVSLWSVADDATRELMINYYKKLVSEQKPRVGAMVEAMSELRQRFPHPYYWAPFIVIGMDGPIGTVTRKQ